MAEEAKNSLIDKEFYERLAKLKLNLKLNPATGLAGNRRSNARGQSLEFSDYREYIPGDDLRRIDWNVYGRTDKLLVKLYMAEKEALFRIIVDCSKSMDFGHLHKGHYASLLAAAIGYIGLEKDRVKLISDTAAGLVSSPVYSGRQSFTKIADQLEHLNYSQTYDLWNVIKNEKMQSNGITLILSDCYMEQNIEDVVKYLLYRKQTVILMHILSEEELFPECTDMDGTLRLLDSETDEKLKVTAGSQMFNNYHRRLELFLQRIRAVCKKYRVMYIPAYTSVPMEETLAHIFRNREGIL